MKKVLIICFLQILFTGLSGQNEITFEAPGSAPQYGVAEFVFRIKDPVIKNPYIDIQINGKFTTGQNVINARGFADSNDGSVFRLRFSPELLNATYQYEISFAGAGTKKSFSGKLVSTKPLNKGPVVVDPVYPKHFIYAGTGEPFIHLGITQYNLVDISNSDSQIEETINYCARHGFNKIRFLLTGYPRDFDNRSSDDVDHGVPEDPWKAPNYGALPGRVNPLPAWQGKPHSYDFERFNVEYWQRIDRAVRLMKEKGIVATCIVIIEKQNLPREIGRLTDNEYRLYNYAVSRLSAFNNVWWDIGNEHNEYRDAAWGNVIGKYLKDNDPYDRLASAHAYAEFFYSNSSWADFIITQQYGDVDSVHNWTLKYYDVRKPYVNEEYGYEGRTDKPVGHGMNGDWIRKCHWAIAMAGGYGTYGDWSNGVSYFYMGIPGPGKAATELRHLKSLLESIPFRKMIPSGNLTTNGYSLSIPGKMWLVYLPAGGRTDIDLTASEKKNITAKWYNPSTGEWSETIKLKRGIINLEAPSGSDWALLATSVKVSEK